MKFYKKHSKIINLIFKVLLSSVALYYVYSKIDIVNTLNTISSINPYLLVLAVVVYALSQVFSAVRLNALYKYVPVKIPQVANIKLYWLGLFYNLFLPGGIGGDGYKVYLINKHHGTSVKRLLATVLADRLSGLVVIFIYLCGLVFFINYDFTNLPLNKHGELGAVNRFLADISPYFKYFIYFIPFLVLAYYMYLRIASKRFVPATWRVMFISFIVQALQMLSAIIILRSMGTEIANKASDYMFLFLLSSVMSAIPVSLGGLGLREVTFMLGSQYLSLNQDNAVALSVVFYLISMVVALFGAYYVYNIKSVFNYTTSDTPNPKELSEQDA